MKSLQKILLLMLAIVLCIGFTACSATEDSSASDSIDKEESSSSIVEGDIDRKIVYNVDLDIEAENVKILSDNLAKKCDEFGGYVEESEDEYESGELSCVWVTYRVPTDKLDAFIDSIEGQGKIQRKEVALKDITTAYVNAEAKKSALEERKNQLEALLSEQGISAGEKVSIINEISSVNSELMEIQLVIEQYDSMVNYSTVKVFIDKAPGFIETMFMVFFMMLFVAGPPAAIVIAIVVIVKKTKRPKEEKVKF